MARAMVRDIWRLVLRNPGHRFRRLGRRRRVPLHSVEGRHRGKRPSSRLGTARRGGSRTRGRRVRPQRYWEPDAESYKAAKRNLVTASESVNEVRRLRYGAAAFGVVPLNEEHAAVFNLVVLDRLLRRICRSSTARPATTPEGRVRAVRSSAIRARSETAWPALPVKVRRAAAGDGEAQRLVRPRRRRGARVGLVGGDVVGGGLKGRCPGARGVDEQRVGAVGGQGERLVKVSSIAYKGAWKSTRLTGAFGLRPLHDCHVRACNVALLRQAPRRGHARAQQSRLSAYLRR